MAAGETAKYNTKGAKIMSTTELTAQIESLRAHEELSKETRAEAETLRDSIKQEMLNRDTDELSAGQSIPWKIRPRH